MKKLLAISWAMPPLLYPRSIQVARILKGLEKAGWDTTVVSVNPASIRSGQIDLSLEKKYSPHYHSIRVDSNEESFLVKFVRRLLFIFNQLPYFQEHWMKNAVGAARELMLEGQFSAIVSFAQPWSDHLIGLELHRTSGMPWVAHFSDPWTDNPFIQFAAFQIPFLRRLEESVIRAADAVVFVSEQTADLVMSKYPSAWRKKVQIIPHSFEPYQQPNDKPAPGERPRKLRIRHVGNFYGTRTPEAFFKGLELLNRRLRLDDKLEVSLVGQNLHRFQPLIRSLGLGGIVALKGPVTVDESRRVCAEADVLLVIDALSENDSLFLPSKLVDYLAFDKPILGITPLRGASADLLRALKCPVAAPENISGIAEAIEDLVSKWLSGDLNLTPEFEQVASKYNLYQTADQMDKLLGSVAALKKENR